MSHFWLLAARNLGRNRKRNFATGSAIAFGFAGILLLAAYTYRATNYIRVYTQFVIHTAHLQIYAPDGFEQFPFFPAKYSLSPEDQAFLRATLASEKGVELVEAQIRGQGLVGNGCASFPFSAQGYEPNVDRAVREHPEVKAWMPTFQFFLAGRGAWNYPESLGAVIVSKGLARALGKTKLHDDFPPAAAAFRVPDCSDPRAQAALDANVQLLAPSWQGAISAVDGEMVGIYTTGFQESDTSGIIAPVSLLQKLFDTDRVSNLAVWLKNAEELGALKARLSQKFQEAGKNFELVGWNEERLSPYYVGTVDFLRTMVVAGGLVLAAIIALSVLNSSTMTILERSQEIGTYRSMGFRRGHLQLLYVQESLLLTSLSLAVGAALGLLAIRGINAAEIVYHPPGVAGGLTLVLILPFLPALLAALFILLLTSLATFFAVTSRLKARPADLLQGVLR